MPSKPTTRPRDSEGTKATILDAARQHFAEHGYERATIRAIAGSAQIDPALVMRYFGNKEKLFAAAADFDLRLPDLTALPPDKIGSVLVEHFLDRWEADDTFTALLRSAVTNEAAATRMRTVLAKQVMEAIASVSCSAEEAAVRAALVATQILGVALCRHVLRLPPVVALTRAELVRHVGPTLQRYLGA